MKIGQVALGFGADDLGSVMIEENVVSAAGTTHRAIDGRASSTLIKALGKTPGAARHAVPRRPRLELIPGGLSHRRLDPGRDPVSISGRRGVMHSSARRPALITIVGCSWG